MLRPITWITLPVLALALTLTSDTSSAEADGFSIQVGRVGFNGYGPHGHRHNYRSYRVPSYRTHYPAYGGMYRSNDGGYYNDHPRHPHLDYHGPAIVPHGNHYDVIRGHYDVHDGGYHRW